MAETQLGRGRTPVRRFVRRLVRWPVPAIAASGLVVAGGFVPDRRELLLGLAAAVPLVGAAAATRRWFGARRLVTDHVRSGWLLISLAAFVAAGTAILGLAVPTWGVGPTATDIPIAASALLGVAGVLALIGGRMPGRRLDSVIEALLVTAPLAYLAVAVVTGSHADAVTIGPGLVTVAAVAGDVILVVLSAELVRIQRHGNRHRAALLVLGGSCCILGAHAVRAGMLLSGAVPAASTAVWLAAFPAIPAILWASAGGHPDGRHHMDDLETVPTPITGIRVAIVLLGVGVGPVVLAARVSSSPTSGVAGLTTGAVMVAAVAVVYLVRLVEQRARMEYLALHDDLCGIPNRVLLNDRIATALAQAPRHGQDVALLYLDLDRFKTINDSLGHAAGNELLRAAATRLQESIRSGDTVARLGGDEFAVLLPDVAEPGAPAAVAEKILESFRAPFDVAGRQLFVSPSIGVSVSPGDASDTEELLKNADAAMYRAKQNGRNTFELYTREMNARAHQRLTLENSLHKAADRGELVMHYQPKVDLRSGHIVGMEALLRWQHPHHGLLLPNEFIELAEETGLIVPVGEWALEEACAQTKAWADAGFQPLTVAVNLSARQFQHQEVGDMVARVLRSTGLDPASLELELTESLALQDPEGVIEVLHDLKAMGVQCSIDDFGTGYSGLLYLTRFPIDRLKIDKFFISEISHGGDNARIVAAVIALAHGLRLAVTAEGVENDEQRQFLHDNGCDEMQGYLFSQPIPAAEFEKLLTRAEDLPPAPLPPPPRLRLVAGNPLAVADHGCPAEPRLPRFLG